MELRRSRGLLLRWVEVIHDDDEEGMCGDLRSDEMTGKPPWGPNIARCCADAEQGTRT